MKDNNSILEKLVNLANEKGFLTLSDINEVLPVETTEINVEELDDLVSSILERDIQIQDDENPIPVNNHLDIKITQLLSKQTSGTNKIESEKDTLINNHIYLVRKIAKEFVKNTPSTMGRDDIIQEGYLGLLTATTDYKPDRGDNFPDFASKYITDFIEHAIENEKRDGIFNSDISRDFFAKEYRDYISSWKEEDEDIYSTIISNQSKSIDKDNSELTLTSISKIQLPAIPDFNRVTPSLTRNDESILVEKKNFSENKNFRTNPPEYIKPFIIDDISTRGEDLSATTNESLPKVYSKVSFDNDRRLSLYAKLVGERGEKIVLKYLADTLMTSESATIRWISKSGETPGWDIEYYDSNNNMVAIEVKGTNGKNFPNIEITGNEWNAAIELQDQYWIYLVSDCLGTDPKIQRLQNPFKLKESGLLRTTPILWRIEMIAFDEQN